jgi:hypothetical protein
MKREGSRFLENFRSVFQTARSHISEDGNLQIYRLRTTKFTQIFI